MVIFPNCKINLGLNIVSKRADGYHNLETCFYPIPFYDVLEIVRSETFQFLVTGAVIDGDAEDNLCVKAYRLLAADHSLPPVYMQLHKTIPTGAGLAGGSSDAAHTLLLLNRKFNLNICNEQLCGYALQLGSDCPFFIHNVPMTGSGRGEILQPVPVSLNDYMIMLVIPGIHISTKAAFEGILPAKPVKPITEIISQPVSTWKDELVNDFERTVFALHPALASIKEALYEHGALYASLTGSGSVVYGIFKKNEVHRELPGKFDASCQVRII